MKNNGIGSLEGLHKKSVSDPSWYWGAVDDDLGIVWSKKYHTICDLTDGKAFSKWFLGGRTNIIASTVEKFAERTPEKVAYHFISEDGAERKITYSELDRLTSSLANSLKALGVRKGEMVAIYMPMVLEAILAILACAKIGAVQTVVFSGYSTESLKIRLQDCRAKVLFVSDGFLRKGKPVSQKKPFLMPPRALTSKT